MKLGELLAGGCVDPLQTSHRGRLLCRSAVPQGVVPALGGKRWGQGSSFMRPHCARSSSEAFPASAPHRARWAQTLLSNHVASNRSHSRANGVRTAAASSVGQGSSTPETPDLTSTLRRSADIIFLAGLLVVFAFSGLVSTAAIRTAAFCGLYPVAIALLVLPAHVEQASNGITPSFQLKDVNSQGWFRVYMRVFVSVGLLIPISFAFMASALGDTSSFQQSCAYLFHLFAQLLGERVLGRSTWCSFPGFFHLPVLFNAFRLIQVWEWCSAAFQPAQAASVEWAAWAVLGQLVSSAQLLIWSFNLFVFLLAFAVPLANKAYFSYKPDVGETAELHGMSQEPSSP